MECLEKLYRKLYDTSEDFRCVKFSSSPLLYLLDNISTGDLAQETKKVCIILIRKYIISKRSRMSNDFIRIYVIEFPNQNKGNNKRYISKFNRTK